jgi:hypothetical protein
MEGKGMTRREAQRGANILKRVIEYLCSGQWSEDRADALETVNCAIEECFACEQNQSLTTAQ